jgi:hypothetical protein
MCVALRRAEPRPYRRRPQLVADRRQGPDARRQEIAVIVDDVVELAEQRGALFVG